MELGRRLEHALGKHHEKVRLQPLPLHGAQARHARPDRHALHVKGDLVAHLHLHFLRQALLQRNRHDLRARRHPSVNKPAVTRSVSVSCPR